MKCNVHSAIFLQTLRVSESDKGLCLYVHIWRLVFKKLRLQAPAVWDGRLIAAFWISSLSVTLHISPYLSKPQSLLQQLLTERGLRQGISRAFLFFKTTVLLCVYQDAKSETDWPSLHPSLDFTIQRCHQPVSLQCFQAAVIYYLQRELASVPSPHTVLPTTFK